jgi:hypothetical protein
LELRLDLPAGIGLSLVRNQVEELLYALFRGVELNLLIKGNNYCLNGHVNVIQVSAFCLPSKLLYSVSQKNINIPRNQLN